MKAFEETEDLLELAISLSKNSVKQIAEESGIMASTIYKWKVTENRHLTPQNSETLLRYFIEKEPQALIEALVLNQVHTYLQDYLTSSTEKEVRKGGMNYDNL